MEHLDHLLARISETTGKLLPLSALPSATAPVPPVQYLLQHLTTTPVHDTYFPFLRFGCMHAARVTAAWAAMTRGRGDVSVMQDLVGYLTVAWGGGTIAALLTSTPPAWLVSPTPWIIYPAIYALLVRSGMSAYIVNTTPALLFNLAMSAVDGMTRGVSITAMPALVAGAPVSAGGWWATAILGVIATNGGGWIAQTLGMNQAKWTTGKPAVLDGGVWSTLDIWGAMLCAVVYGALTRAYPALEPVGDFLSARIPSELRDASVVAKATGGPVVTKDTARAIAVLLLGSLFAVRAVVVQILQWQSVASRTAAVKKEITETVKLVPATVVKSPAEVTGSPKPKKRKARKSKSPTP